MSETTAAVPTPAPPGTALVPAKAQPHAVTFGEQGAQVRDSRDLWAVAKIMAHGLARGTTPTERDVYGVAVMIQAGAEVGLSPVMSTRALYAVNGRPAWMLEGLVGVMRDRGIIPRDDADGWTYAYENLPPDGTPIKDWPNEAACVVTFRRVGWREPKLSRFSVGDAKLAGLWGKAGPWSNYPKRQLYARAGGFLARDYAGDVTLGLRVVEEERDVVTIDEPARLGAPPTDESAPDVTDAIIAGQDFVPEAAEPTPPAEPAAAPAALGPRPFDAGRADVELQADVDARVDEAAARKQLRAEATRDLAMVSAEDFAEARQRLREHRTFGDARKEPEQRPEAPGQAGLFGAGQPARRETAPRKKGGRR